MCSPQRDISNERLIVTRKTPPKIGKCVCFTLCWILLYRSWRISENTSAPTCKAVVRKSLAYVRSLWRTPCTKKMPLWMHMTPKRWCTGHSPAGGEKKWQNLSSVLRSESIDTGSMVWACHPHTHPVQNSSRYLLAPRGHLHLLPFSPPPAPSPPWATPQWSMSPRSVSPNSSGPLLIQSLAWL